MLSIPLTELTIGKGHLKLTELLKKQSIDSPFVVFIDDCILSNQALNSIDLGSPAFYGFLRNILRRLHVISIFSGTDPSTANYFSSYVSPHSRLGDNIDFVWAAVINDTPSYSIIKSEDRTKFILEKHNNNLIVTDMVEFLRDVRSRENPWIIELIPNHMESSSPDSCFESYLQDIFESVFKALVERKHTEAQFTTCLRSHG